MRPVLARTAFLALVMILAGAACGSSTSGAPAPEAPSDRSQLAEEDRHVPSYGNAELTRALIAERGAEATAERVVVELESQDARDPAADDRLRVARADLAVRRRFITALETCESTGRWCPPRLDDPAWAFDPDPAAPRDPPLDAPLRYDLASWRALTAELHGRACACRTLACIDSLGVALDLLEPRPARDVQSDDAATASLTRARECLFRLRGKSRRY